MSDALPFLSHRPSKFVPLVAPPNSPAPTCSPVPEQLSKIVRLVSPGFLDVVRVGVWCLLTETLHDYRKEICSGSQVDHPIKNQHECLEVVLLYFY